MRDTHRWVNVIALLLMLALSMRPHVAQADDTIFDLICQFGPETHVVSWRQPCCYETYRRWLQTASQWAAQVGGDPASGWSYYSAAGSVAAFDAAQDGEQIVAQLRTQPAASPPVQEWQPGIATVWGVGLDFAKRAATAWTGMWTQTWPMGW